MKAYAVVGNPVEHSLSPLLHEASMNIHRIQGKYTKINTKDFKKTLDILTKSDTVHGLSIMMPYKEDAYKLADAVDNTVIDSVNTLTKVEGLWIGSNTDAPAGLECLIKALPDKQVNGKNILIIGAGGTAKALVYVLSELDANVFILNRTKALNKRT